MGSSATTDILGNTDASLSIINTDDTANNTAGLHFAWQDTDGTPNFAGASIVAKLGTKVAGQYPAGELAFLTSSATNNAPSEKVRITSAGNVGIGTTNPGAKLDVAGQIKITGGSPGAGKVLTSDASGLASWQTGAGGGGITSINNMTGPTISITAGSGISISNAANTVTITNTGGAGGLSGSGSTNYVSKWTGSTSLGNSIIYDNGGNVGIGTTNPGQKLDVQGNIRLGGYNIYMANSNSHFYGDGANLASRPVSGDFHIQNSVGGAGHLLTNTICLSGDCRSSWPAGGGINSVTFYTKPLGRNENWNIGVHKFCALSLVQVGWNTNIGNTWLSISGSFNRTWYLQVTGAHSIDNAGAVCFD
jgi:hypothetical protein